MDSLSISLFDINSSDLNNISNKVTQEYGVIVRLVTSVDDSFERALSISLFGNEEELKSISSTLHSQYDLSVNCSSVYTSHILLNKTHRSSHHESNQDDSYIMLAAKIYGITIYIHTNHSVQVYKMENDCPIIHLIKLKLEDGSSVYLATEKNSITSNDDKDTVNHIDGDDINTSNSCIKEHEEDVGCISTDVTTIATLSSLNVTIRQIESDGNCFFRSLSDQLTGSQHGHVVLRQLIVDFISENREIFEMSIDKEHFSSWDDFIYQMYQHGTFADGIVVVASAMFLRRYVVIHQQGQRPLIFKTLFPVKHHNQIHIAYNSKTLHYNSMSSIDGSRLHIDETE